MDLIAEHGFIAPAGPGIQDLLFSSTPPIRLVTSITDDGRLAGAVYTPEGGSQAFRTLAKSGAPVPSAAGDVVQTGDLALSLRARRPGSAPRRFQGIVQCSDTAGSSKTATFEVTVPHDQGGN